MRCNKHNVFILALFALLCFGCASRSISVTPTVSKSTKPNDEKAYIYGRLSKWRGGPFGGYGLAMVIKSVDETRKYHFEFKKEDGEVRVLEVEPGTYRTGGPISAFHATPHPLDSVLFTVESGKAYYIGDFSYIVRSRPYQRALWVQEEAVDRFGEASEELKTKYPYLRQLAQSNLMAND